MAAPPTQKTAPGAKLSLTLAAWMPVITVLLAIAYAVAAYFLLLVPKIQPLMAGGEYDFTSIKTQLADDEVYVQKMKSTMADFKKIDDENRVRVAGIMPFEPDIPGLFVQMDEIARTNNMLLQSIDTVVDEKTVSPLGRKTMRISLTVAGGDYAQFKLFLADIERSMRLFDVTTTSLSPDSTSYGVVIKSYFIDRKAVPSAAKP